MTEIERDYQKAVRVIKSCDRFVQKDTCEKYMVLFHIKHGDVELTTGLSEIFHDKFYGYPMINN